MIKGGLIWTQSSFNILLSNAGGFCHPHTHRMFAINSKCGSASSNHRLKATETPLIREQAAQHLQETERRLKGQPCPHEHRESGGCRSTGGRHVSNNHQ